MLHERLTRSWTSHNNNTISSKSRDGEMATETLTSSSTTRPSQVRIRLRTNDEDIQLPTDIGAILVSTDLRRYQLSTLVNKLLEASKPIPLEFLINGQYLRTTIDEFITQNGISTETTLNVEYVRALIPPLPVASYPHDDWISSVDVLSTTSKAASWQAGIDNLQSRIVSASFDGVLRVWNSSNTIIATGTAHVGPVKDIKFISPTKAVSAGTDRTVCVWDFTDTATDNASLAPALELYGHTSSVDKIAVHGPSSRILSASADRTVGIWSTSKSASPAVPENLLPGAGISNKRRKLAHTPLAKSTVSQRGALSLMSGHQAQVSAVCFDEKDSTVGYSASWDHSVKTWDLTTSTCVDTRTTSQSLYALAHLSELSLLAAGTSARHITLVDPRASATTVSAMTLKGHTNSISSIAKDPSTSYQIVSGSHDGTCRIWDLRSARSDIDGKTAEAVYVIERESTKGQTKRPAGEGIKVFDVAWDAEVGIASVGEDKNIQINKSA